MELVLLCISIAAIVLALVLLTFLRWAASRQFAKPWLLRLWTYTTLLEGEGFIPRGSLFTRGAYIREEGGLKTCLYLRGVDNPGRLYLRIETYCQGRFYLDLGAFNLGSLEVIYNYQGSLYMHGSRIFYQWRPLSERCAYLRKRGRGGW